MTITTNAADTAAVSTDDTTGERPRRGKATTATGVDAALVDQLVAQARERGLQLSGEGGLLQQLTKIVLESAWTERSPSTLVTTSTTRPGRTAATLATVCGPRRC
jgi:hypothetical protein